MVTKYALVVLSLVALSWVSCTPPPKCPSDDTGEATLFVDPDNCGGFYECSHGVAYPINCTAGLYYNVELKTCDFQNDVDCGNRPTTPKPSVD